MAPHGDPAADDLVEGPLRSGAPVVAGGSAYGATGCQQRSLPAAQSRRQPRTEWTVADLGYEPPGGPISNKSIIRNSGQSGAPGRRRSTLSSQPITVPPQPQIAVHVCGLDASTGSVTSAMSVVSRMSPCAFRPHRAVVVSPIASASISKMQTSPVSRRGRRRNGRGGEGAPCSGERAGLDVRHTEWGILGSPIQLVGVDPQLQADGSAAWQFDYTPLRWMM